MLMTFVPILLAGVLFAPTRAQTLRANAPANIARRLPRQAARSSIASQAGAPAATTFPATMSEDFEGAWPAAGWTLQDYGNTGGEYLFGQRNCKPQNGNYAA
jgi:hypothetical protein